MSTIPITQDPALSSLTGPSTTPSAPAAAAKQAPAGESRPFSEVLASASSPGLANGLHFSRHALERVQRRGITLEPSTLSRLQEGVGRAASKGSRDSVVLVEGTAFVVSVANRTVLTAVPQEHMREQVFTNIDSAVIA